MKAPIVLLLVAAAGFGFADAKSDCIKALESAKKAGLPFSVEDLHNPIPGKGAVSMLAILKEAEPTLNVYRGRTIQIQQSWEKEFGKKRDVKVLNQRLKVDPQLISLDRKILVIANRLTATQLTVLYVPPSSRSKDWINAPGSSKFTGLLMQLMRSKVDDAARSADASNLPETISKLYAARRLPRLALSNASFLCVLQCEGTEKRFYQELKKVINDHPVLAKGFPLDLVSPIPSMPTKKIIAEEFLQTLVILTGPKVKRSESQQVANMPSVYLPTDEKTLVSITKCVRNFVKVYEKLGTAKDFVEAGRMYRQLKPSLETEKSPIAGVPDEATGVSLFGLLDRLQDMNGTRNALAVQLRSAKKK